MSLYATYALSWLADSSYRTEIHTVHDTHYVELQEMRHAGDNHESEQYHELSPLPQSYVSGKMISFFTEPTKTSPLPTDPSVK